MNLAEGRTRDHSTLDILCPFCDEWSPLGVEHCLICSEKWQRLQRGFVMSVESTMNDLADLVIAGLNTDGAHHKQWYLYQIAELLGLELEECDEGIAP